MTKECPACGHVKGKEWEDGELVEVNEGGDEFVQIEGSFHREPTGYRSSGKVEVSLYGCPECGNVIFQD